MNKKMFLLQMLNLWRLIPVWFMVIVQPKGKRELILREIDYWKKCSQINSNIRFQTFSILLIIYKEYRNLLIVRIRGISGILIKILFPPIDTLQICTSDIAENIYIQHGFATNISAKKIGANCWINQQVTIGYSFDSEPPTLGNGVRVCAGAKVIGNIYIGDNVIIGANAVVVKDVESNTIVGGVPAKKIGVNLKHKLWYQID